MTRSSGAGPRLLSPWRRGLQWAVSLLLLLLPWLQAGGESLLRIDIPQLRLYLFGQVLHIEELYLVLLFGLVLTLGFLLLTVILGRVWCGWLCPQTTLSDLAEWWAARLGLAGGQHGKRALWRLALLQAGYLLLAFTVAANLLWYFIEPRQFFAQLVTLDLHEAAWLTLVLTGLLVYLDLALVRRLLCREFCPYGRFQTALVDASTLTLHLPGSEQPRCIRCGACVRACPMGIDIRAGYQVACINCGRCLDACRQVMAKRDEPGLIRYTFGLTGAGPKGLLNPRVLLPAAALLALLVLLAAALSTRTAVSLQVAVSHTVPARQLADGRTATFFNAWVNNRSRERLAVTLRPRGGDSAVELRGQLQVDLAPGENRRIDFVVVTAAAGRVPVHLELVGPGGAALAAADAEITGFTKETTP